MPRSLSVGVAVAVLLALAAPARGAMPPEVTLVLCDGSIVKGVTPPEAVEMVTKYGTLSVPFKDVRRIEFGLRLSGLPWLRGWEQDTLTTADCVLTGRLAAKDFKVHSRVLGEVSVRVADLWLVRGAGVDAARPASDVRAQLTGIREVVGLAQSGVTDVGIIYTVGKQGIVYSLNADQIRYLKQHGVSDVVIKEMQATADRRAGSRTAGTLIGGATGAAVGNRVDDRMPPLPAIPDSTPPLPRVP